MMKKEFAKGINAIEAGTIGTASNARKFKSANQNFLLGKLGGSFKKVGINLEDVLKREKEL